MSTKTVNPSVIKQFFSSRIHNQEINYTHPPYDYEEQLLEAIGIGDVNRATETLAKINQIKRATLASNPIRSHKNSLIAICTLFTRAIIKGGVNSELAFHLSDAYILEIEKTSEIENLKQLEYDMLHNFINVLMNERQKKVYSKPVKLAISYIYENILHELPLDVIARHAQVHSSYLSNKFKSEVGMTVTEFINRKRVEDSKFFLLHTNTPISTISVLFKFCNQSYYTSLFKKYTGVTPHQFKNKKNNT